MRITDFVTLPAPVQTAIYLLSCTSVIAVVATFDPKIAWIVAAGVAALALVIVAFIGIRRWNAKRRAASMTTELTRSASGAALGANAAKLDEIRSAFLDGVSKFGDKENIYKIPWFVIVGEPGGGKTEAIRHCGVRFPPGLHEKGTETLGAGGTRNMNWWFTDEGVFLDTAGRLMFEDVAPGENNEWREFLRLLGRNRPNCPINGLLLVIPADVLIKDKDAELERKANKIAQQFEVIQRTLDIRFPVFVVVTKSDLLSGFREFFDDFADAEVVNQMLGWSNPADRDTPFAPERVTEHLSSVVERIKRRRLSLLHDPVPRKEPRRADEVDALYSLPQSIELIAPRLRQYLERIFVQGPWSPKPLFLRGIYFTSSMRDGSVLDQELALALGLRADDLKEMRAWEKERAYFLRDIFTNKVFREKGLVTRATNTRKMLRTRSLILWGSGTALALAFVGFTFYAYRQFSESIKRHSDLWNTAKVVDDWKVDGHWKPIVSAVSSGETVAKFRGAEPPVTVGNDRIPLLTYHERLRDAAGQRIETGWVYRPMLRAANLDQDRLRAQRIVFEASAVYPLVESARHRMLKENVETAIDKDEDPDSRFAREANALSALLRIESDRVTGKKDVDALPEAVVIPLLQYVTASRIPADERSLNTLRSEFVAAYARNPSGKWVPERLGQGSVSLPANAPIQAGLARLKALADRTVSLQLESAAQISGLRDELNNFRRIEREMESIANGTELSDKETKLKAALSRLATIKATIDDRLKSAQEVFAGDKLSMLAAYKRLVTDSKSKSEANFQKLRDEVKPLLQHPTEKLFQDVDIELARGQENVTKQVAQIFSEKDQEELATLDAYLDEYLDGGNGSRVYAGRYATYAMAVALADEHDKIGNLLGTGWKAYGYVQKAIGVGKEQVTNRTDRLSPKRIEDIPRLIIPCNIWFKIAEERRLAALAQAYLQQTATAFSNNFYSPLVATREQPRDRNWRDDASRLMGQWRSDLASPEFLKSESPAKGKLLSFLPDLDKMQAAASAYDTAAAAFNRKKAAYEAALAQLKVNLRFVDQKYKKYRTLNGKDIYAGGHPEWTDVGRSGISLNAADPPNYRSYQIFVPTGEPGPLTKTVAPGNPKDSDEFSFVVEHSGKVPPKPEWVPPSVLPPSKAEILQKLR